MNEMNSHNYEEEQWFPQLPEGFEAQQTEQASWSSWESQPMALNGWNQHQQPGWNQPPQQGWNQWQNPSHSQPGWPGFPGSSHQPGWPGNSHQQGWPGQSNWPWQGGMDPQPPPYPGSGGGGGNQQSAPTSAPPSQAPAYPDQQGAQMLRVDPGGIRGCMFRMTYIWTSRRRGFWFFPTFVGRTSVAGYRWNEQWRRWTYTGLDLDRVEAFTCI